MADAEDLDCFAARFSFSAAVFSRLTSSRRIRSRTTSEELAYLPSFTCSSTQSFICYGKEIFIVASRASPQAEEKAGIWAKFVNCA